MGIKKYLDLNGLSALLDNLKKFFVPSTRTVNGKSLSANISLTASDVNADASGSSSEALASAKAYTDSANYIPKTQAGMNAGINLLGIGSDVPSIDDYYVSQWADGSKNTYHRRPVSKLYQCFKNKFDSDGEYAKKTYVDEAVDNIEIGGRNLLLNTNGNASCWGMNRNDGAYTITNETMLGVNGVVFDIKAVSTWWSLIAYKHANILFDKIQPNTEYTVSCDIWSSVAQNVTQISIKDPSGTDAITTQNKVPAIPAETWTRVETTITTLANFPDITDQYLYWDSFNKIGQIKICNLKLEKGNKATDWSPAPEDTPHIAWGTSEPPSTGTPGSIYIQIN